MGKHPAPSRYAAADLRGSLDENDGDPQVGEGDGRAHPGDSRPDHQHLRNRLDPEVRQGSAELGPGDSRPDESNRLVRGPFPVVPVRPGTLLPEVHLAVHVRVQARPKSHGPEGIEVELGGAGGDHDAVELLLPDGLYHLPLGGVRAGEQEGPGHDDSRFPPRRFAYPLPVQVVGDVPAAVAEECADPFFRHRLALLPSR